MSCPRRNVHEMLDVGAFWLVFFSRLRDGGEYVRGEKRMNAEQKKRSNGRTNHDVFNFHAIYNSATLLFSYILMNSPLLKAEQKRTIKNPPLRK